MTVLFDVSIIGYSLMRRQYRTGIFRVAVSLLEALAARPDLRVLAYSSSGNHWLAARVLRERGLGHIPVVGSGFWGSATFLFLLGRNWASRKGWRTTHTVLAATHRWLEHRRASSDRDLVTTADWYLSPMEAAPDFLRALPTLRRAYVLHDLIPLVLEDYKQDQSDPTKWFPRFLRALGPEDTLFAVSQFTKTDFLRLHPQWDDKRLVVAPNAIEANRFGPGEVPPHSPFFLTVSTIEPRKRIDTIAAAFGLYRAAGGQAELIVVGANRDGHQREVLDRLPEAVRPFVRFPGYVADEALPGLYRSCLAFLYVSEYEGFGLPVLEAMACGTPVVVSALTSLPEVAGPAGIYVSSNDPSPLAQVLGRLEQDESWRQERGRLSLEQAAGFSWQRTAGIIAETMKEPSRVPSRSQRGS